MAILEAARKPLLESLLEHVNFRLEGARKPLCLQTDVEHGCDIVRLLIKLRMGRSCPLDCPLACGPVLEFVKRELRSETLPRARIEALIAAILLLVLEIHLLRILIEMALLPGIDVEGAIVLELGLVLEVMVRNLKPFVVDP